MPNQPTSRTLQPPPSLPSMPDVSTTLTGYLSNFSLWCRHGFADKLSGSQALPGILLQAYDAPAGTPPNIYLLRINQAGNFVAEQVPLGGGKP
jgi:hypothetical protein